jgi:acyl-CoA thioesterase
MTSNVREMLSRDRFAARAGIELLDVRDGYGRARMVVDESHLNGLDVAQGGAVFTLADFAFAAACNSHDRPAVAIDVSISYLKAVSAGKLVAEATEEALTERLSTCLVRVTDSAGDLVALFKGTAYRKRPAPAVVAGAATKG